VFNTTKRGEIYLKTTPKKREREGKGESARTYQGTINGKEEKERRFSPFFLRILRRKPCFSSRLRRLLLRSVLDPCSTKNILSNLLQTHTCQSPPNGVSIFSRDE